MTKRKVFRNRYCMQCGEILPVSSQGGFCSSQCSRTMKAQRGNVYATETAEIQEALRTVKLMKLYAELDRCATHWERAKIQAEIEATK